jgi:hypothetical protein
MSSALGNPAIVAVAGLLFVLAYCFKAYGWRRLLTANERPGALALAAAGGGASIMGVVLPGRFVHAWSFRPRRAAHPAG